MTTIQKALFLLLTFASYSINAQTSLPNTITEMRVELDIVNYDLSNKDARVKRLKELVPHTETLAKKNKDDAGFQMMAGFYNAQYAGYKGGVGALKYAKAARKFLEKSIELDPSLHGSSAHIVLGSLYAHVPGWPIGFGDKKKAVLNYQAALQLSPDGIDSNFTYAIYLYGQKKFAEAKIYLEKADKAPARADRLKADKDLKKQIQNGLEKIEQKLAEK